MLYFLLFLRKEKITQQWNELRAREGKGKAGAMKEGKKVFLSLLCLFYLQNCIRLP